MEQVSRPFQIVLVLVLGFAGMWFVALRPKADTGTAPPATPAPAAQAPGAAQSDAAPQKSAIPGGLGNAVDKARDAKVKGDADAASRSSKVDAAADSQPQTPTKSPAKPAVSDEGAAKTKVATGATTALVGAGKVAYTLVDTGVEQTADAKGLDAAARHSRPGFATPDKIRTALAKHKAVVLLFFNARASDDRQVRRELSAVDRRNGRVKVWGVSVSGLPRFKNVMQGVEVLQTPTTVVLSNGAPYIFPSYTDRAEIDQATAMALRAKKSKKS